MHKQNISKQSNSISVLLLKLQSLEILVPKVMIADVVTWNTELFKARKMPEKKWYSGEYDWQQQSVPLISFEKLLNTKQANDDIQKRKVVVIKTNKNEFYALDCRGFPKPLILSQVSLDKLARESSQEWIAYSLLIGSRELSIPDFPALESVINDDQEMLHQTA